MENAFSTVWHALNPIHIVYNNFLQMLQLLLNRQATPTNLSEKAQKSFNDGTVMLRHTVDCIPAYHWLDEDYTST